MNTNNIKAGINVIQDTDTIGLPINELLLDNKQILLYDTQFQQKLQQYIQSLVSCTFHLPF